MSHSFAVILRFIVVIVSILGASWALINVADAADANQAEQIDKMKSTTITINLDADNCVIEPLEPDVDNCALQFGAENSPCKGKKDCICSKKDKRIVWKTSPGKEFEILFTASTNDKHKKPFHNCDLKAGGDDIVDCKVKHKGTYTYDVAVKDCAGSNYDPVIIIQ
ncbi:hypothetical protein E2K93_14095 [Thalassotalea sp. HSM 43]|uniref:hypothetical protein n=1 Tax=Thalassotalea sp. HSM 43 TaxID=2552945 RepID=UPI0010801F73|nr:hypothetical protein [Thalassotalea sp. HSM 43]QBY05432.1 hypothetical protein E2K93_14095 [Thalassotalea sp. HSM 43]